MQAKVQASPRWGVAALRVKRGSRNIKSSFHQEQVFASLRTAFTGVISCIAKRSDWVFWLLKLWLIYIIRA